jgi:hypothetical protein
MASSQRRSREDTRELLLDAAKLVVRDEGLSALNFKNVFDRLEKERGIRLTNASVIGRAWKNLAEFKADVLVAIALDENDTEIDRTLEGLGPFLAHVDRSTPEARRAAMQEICRLGGAANLQVMRQSGNWPLWISAWDAVNSNDELGYRARIQTALVAGYDAFNLKIEEVYRAVASLLGYRLRDSLTLRQFTIAIDTMGQGCGLRDRFDSSNMDGILRPTGPGGELQEWTLFGIALDGLVRQFFELDPDWSP